MNINRVKTLFWEEKIRSQRRGFMLIFYPNLIDSCQNSSGLSRLTGGIFSSI